CSHFGLRYLGLINATFMMCLGLGQLSSPRKSSTIGSSHSNLEATLYDASQFLFNSNHRAIRWQVLPVPLTSKTWQSLGEKSGSTPVFAEDFVGELVAARR